ncbi:MAG: NAD(+) synthase [Terriglobales bacterium]
MPLLRIDAAAAAEQIERGIRRIVVSELRRRGAVIGLSGGIDSSVTAALCVRALGARRVLGVLMPERESASESLTLGKLIAEWLGIEAVVENIGPILEAAGSYRRRDAALQALIPEYVPGCGLKLVLPGVITEGRLPVYFVVVKLPSGELLRCRPTAKILNEILAASSFKQRTRKMIEYYHADRLRYAVAGTPNRLEYDQGFFVKNGDGAADLKPIAHLYKSQVYQLARYLRLPEVLQQREPTTDTFSLRQSQEEFYFTLPLEQFDLCLYGKNQGMDPAQIAEVAGMPVEQVARAYSQIELRRRATQYLHTAPMLIEPVDLTVTTPNSDSQ